MKPDVCHATGKVGYSNRHGAELMIGVINERRGDNKLRHAYECPDCGNWHLTSHPHAAWVIEHRPSRWQRFLGRVRSSFEVWPA